LYADELSVLVDEHMLRFADDGRAARTMDMSRGRVHTQVADLLDRLVSEADCQASG
jgi:hypothetical protein